MTPPRERSPAAELEVLDRRRRKRQRAKRSKRKRNAFLLALAAIVAAIVAATVGGAASVFAYGSQCDLSALRPVAIGQNSFIYAADGTLLGAIPAERNRQPVSLARMSRWMPKATVAIEDRRFYQHGGVDFEGIARALWEDVRAGKVVQGGSTITQQLVRNLYPVSRERTVERKIKEACLAIKLNKAWSKRQILSTYMNYVYYGNLAYGIEAAAQTYFSKHASELTLPQAALLAGLPQAPSSFEPFNNSQKALERRGQVLSAMLANGAITHEQYAWVTRRPLALEPGKLYKTIREPYFFAYVRDELQRKLPPATVHSGGLKVYTTIIPRYQRAAVKAIRDTLPYRDDPAAALISIDPRTGAIRAMTAVIPGRRNNKFNLLSQARRQPGSTFKTFVLTAAVEMGANPDTEGYVSAPFYYRPTPNGDCAGAGGWWCVTTYGGDYYGWSSIASATLRSDNTVYAQLTLDVGPERVAATARKLGVRGPLDVKGAYVPSMGLGSIPVSPLDLASGYATLAAGGIYSEPTAIRRVVLANGKEDEASGWGTPKRRRVISDGVAYAVTQVLERNMTSGTGTNAYFGRPAAGKTGTTEKHADAWFSGYTPTLQTTVWMGYIRGEIPMENVHGIAVAGSTFPSQIWHQFMVEAIGNTPAIDFPTPTHWAVWRDFEKDTTGRSFGYSGYDRSYRSATTTEAATTTAPASTAEAPAPKAEKKKDRKPTPPAPVGTPAPTPPADPKPPIDTDVTP